MAESYFGDKAGGIPGEAQLYDALGGSGALWKEFAGTAGGSGEWKFYTKAAGWVYQVKQGKRTLFYLLPKAGHFKLTFVYGERAVEAAKTAGLPPAVLDALLQARAYMEGRSVALEVHSADDLETAKKMLKIKLEN